MGFNVYKSLTELSNALTSPLDSLDESYKICWENVSHLTEAIVSDISSILNQECFVTTVRFYLDDPTYKQSASGCFVELKVDQEDEFTIALECLIDFGKVMLWVKQSPLSQDYFKISEFIETKYDSEFKANLMTFKN